MPARECSLLETFQLRILTSNAHTKFVVSAHVLMYCILPDVFCRLYFLLFAVYCIALEHAEVNECVIMSHADARINTYILNVYYILFTIYWLLCHAYCMVTVFCDIVLAP